MKKLVTELFDAYIRTKLHTKPDVLKFILNHERKETCIDNLQKEIRVAEWKVGFKMNYAKVKLMVNTVANMFANNALEAERIKHMTLNEGGLIGKKEREMNDLEEQLNDEKKFVLKKNPELKDMEQ